MRIVAGYAERQAVAATRFRTGLANYVYEVWLEDGRSYVVRLSGADQRGTVVAATYWYGLLAPLGVPLPELLAFDADPSPGAFPYMLIERLPGRDLGDVYAGLAPHEKRTLAKQMAEIQELVGQLAPAQGYGYARSYADVELKPAWIDVVLTHLARSRTRLEETGIVPVDHVDRLEAKVLSYKRYLDGVAPSPFLDDTTTKNVLIHEGRLSGIVDVDHVCFGDRLYTVALTRTALLSRELPADYIEFWCEALRLGDEQEAILDLYTAVFCLDFLSEYGLHFNRDEPLRVDWANVKHLVRLFETLTARI